MTGICAYCGSPLPKGKKKYCCTLHEHLWWYRVYEEEIARPGHRPSIPGAWDYVRDAALGAAGHKCQQCGKTDTMMIRDIRAQMQGKPYWEIQQRINEFAYFEVHHIVPLSHGGDSQLDNLVVLCVECHRKAHREIRVNSGLKQKHQQTLLQAVTA